MTEAREQLFNYLINISGGKLTLNPEQLEKVIDISPKQQSNLRQKNIFPIPFKKIGKLIHYPINAVINYLLDGSYTDVEQEVKEIPTTTKTTKKAQNKNNKNVQNLSHIFMMRTFVSKLQEQAKQAEELSQILTKVADINSNYSELKQELS